MAWWTSFSAPFRRLTRRFWITFVFAWLAAQAVELAATLAEHQHGENGGVSSSLVVATGFYQKLATRKRAPVVRYTSLVIIDPVRDIKSVSRSNVCAERDFLARMLERLADAGVKTIVIDKYFGAETCPNGDPGTLRLLGTVDHLRKGEPIEAGKPAHPPMSIIVGLQAVEVDEKARKLRDVTSYVQPALHFETNETRGQQGLCNAAPDVRRLALQWSVYPDERGAADGNVVTADTLAFAAARKHNPRLLNENRRLADLVRSGKQPYIGFLEPAQFEPYRHFASEIVCGKPLASQQDWPGCFGHDPVPPEVASRIVLIAEEDPADQHNTIVGRIAGYYLQANYIEAILDDRYLMPAWRGVDTVFSFAILLAMELLLVVFHDSPVRAVLSILALGGLVAFVIFEVIVNLEVYVDPAWVTLTYVVFRLSHIVYSRVRNPEHEEPPSTEPPGDSPQDHASPPQPTGA